MGLFLSSCKTCLHMFSKSLEGRLYTEKSVYVVGISCNCSLAYNANDLDRSATMYVLSEADFETIRVGDGEFELAALVKGLTIRPSDYSIEYEPAVLASLFTCKSELIK